MTTHHKGCFLLRTTDDQHGKTNHEVNNSDKLTISGGKKWSQMEQTPKSRERKKRGGGGGWKRKQPGKEWRTLTGTKSLIKPLYMYVYIYIYIYIDIYTSNYKAEWKSRKNKVCCFAQQNTPPPPTHAHTHTVCLVILWQCYCQCQYSDVITVTVHVSIWPLSFISISASTHQVWL